MKGDSNISTKFPKHIKKGLKADEILAQRSAIPAVSLRKRAGGKPSDSLIPTKRQRTDWVPHKELMRLKKVADGQLSSNIETQDATFDMWGTIIENGDKKSSEFLPTKEVTKAPKSLQQKPISLIASGKEVPAVQMPTGGYSYNPLFTDYEARLTDEGAKAVNAERQRIEAEEVERQKEEATARSAAEAEAAEERANMSEWEEDSEWEGFQSGVEDEKPGVKRPQRKTQAQRNRIKKRKEEERLAKHKAAMKARRIQEQRIKEIAEEVEQRDQARALVLAEDSEDGHDVIEEKVRRKQLGKFKLPERDLELVLPDELEESLRRLKPEGNLLKDRYRSMLLRGKIESRRHISFKKQAKRKLTEKWTHKDFVL